VLLRNTTIIIAQPSERTQTRDCLCPEGAADATGGEGEIVAPWHGKGKSGVARRDVRATRPS
jgi:hypothetical protein